MLKPPKPPAPASYAPALPPSPSQNAIPSRQTGQNRPNPYSRIVRDESGLGKFEAVNKIEMVWFDGERSELDGPLRAGARYRIERLAAPDRAAMQGQPTAETARP